MLALVVGLSSACAPIVRTHGYVPSQADLDAVFVGADTKASIADTLGTPGSSGVREDGSWFYVQSTVETLAFLAPEVVARRVVVMDFDGDGVLQDVSQYGLEDGRVIDLKTRVTPTDSRRVSILARIFGNVAASPLVAPPE